MRTKSLSAGRDNVVFGRVISITGGAKYYFNIISITPTNANSGSGNTVVQVLANGINAFDGNSVPYLNGVPAVTYTLVNPFRIDVTIPAALVAVPGFVSIRIRDSSAPDLRYSNNVYFAVNYPVPTLTAATFDGTNVTATGTGYFVEGTYGVIDGTYTVPFTWISSTSGTVPVPPEIINIPGNHQLRIVNPEPGGGQSAQQPFPVKFLAPRIQSMTPIQQFAGRDSGTITLVGDPDTTTYAFYPNSVVRVDATSVPFTLVDETHITFSISPALMATPGVKAITVSNPTAGGGGGTSNAMSFTSFSPTFDAISISQVPQYFDGFPVTGHVDFIDTNFVATFGGVDQPTTILDSQNFVVNILSATMAVPGVTTIRLRDTISSAVTNAQTMTVASWTPLRLGATLRFWGDGTSLVDDGTGKAQAWNDMSGGDRHFVQATSTKRPQIVASSSVLNNKPVARFNAANNTQFTYTQWLAVAAVGLIQKDKYTIYAVAAHATTGTGQTIIGDTNGVIYVASTNLAPERLDSGDGSGPGNAIWPTPFAWVPPPNKPFVARFRKALGNIGARINRNAEVIQTHGTNLAAFTPLVPYIGSKGGANGLSNADIAEIIICDTNLNATQRAILDNRLSAIYNLPFGAPGTQPVITSIAPVSCTQYDLPFWIVVTDTGGGYTTNTVVNAFDQILVTEYLSPTQVRGRMTNDALVQAGGMPISVASESGISAPIGLTIFPYVDVPGKPNIHTTVPNNGLRFGAPLFIRVLGVGFTAASVIKWNGNSITTAFVSANEITGTLPVQALDLLPGPIITVDDPSGLSPNSAEITLSDWSPLSIPGLTGWWAADDVLTAAGKITQWNDKSGQGRHFAQADTAKQALYNAADAAFNGKPSAQFDGVDDTYTGPSGATLIPGGTTDTVYASVYRYLVVDGAGIPSQPYVNDIMISIVGWGVSAHLSPLTLIGYASDGTYRSVSNAGLVVNATQRCQFRITGLSMTLEIGDTASAPFALASFAPGTACFIGYINFGTNNAMNGKLAVWITCNLAWSAETSIRWGNYCRYTYGTP